MRLGLEDVMWMVAGDLDDGPLGGLRNALPVRREKNGGNDESETQAAG
jgi:hypothetical protein